MDVFSLTLEIRNAGSQVDIFTPVPLNKRELVSLGDCISPTPRNWEELERPVDVFTPVPLNKREMVSPGDVFSPD